MKKNVGVNNNNLKHQNRGLIYKLIVTGNNPSRIHLSKVSRLSKMSVSNIVSELIENNLAREVTLKRNGEKGRTPIGLSVSHKAPKIIGLLVDRSVCCVIVCDFKMKILYKNSVEIKKCNSTAFLNIVYMLVEEALNRYSNVVGIGVGSLGPVDIENGIILNPTNFYGIMNLPIVPLLERRFDLPVFIDNQMNCAALAEKYFGVGNLYHDFIYLGITSGIGAGIMSDGNLYRNVNGISCEMGHVSIDYKGVPCECGNVGCLEAYVSSRVIERKAEKATGKEMSFKEICENLDNPVLKEIIDDMEEKLTFFLTSAVNLFNPQAIVMGHECIHLPNSYLDKLRNNLNEKKICRSYNYIEVVRPVLLEKTTLIGCACCVADRVFNGELLFG